MSTPSAYHRLKARFDRIGRLRSVDGLLAWDSYAIMPAGAAQARAGQIETIQTIIAELLSDPRVSDDLAEAGEQTLDEWDTRNLQLMRTEHTMATAVDPGLTGALAKASALCESHWRKARAAKDGAGDVTVILGSWTHLVALVREAGQALGEALALDPHDALMARWDPGVTSAKLRPLMAAIAPHLAERAGKARSNPPMLPPHVPVKQQRKLAREVCDWLAYDFEHGVLMESAQPCFMDDSPEDVRVTSRYEADDFRVGVIGLTHEIGHFHYERGMPAQWLYQPIGRPASAGMQESQSILFEKHFVRGGGFLSRLSRAMPGLTQERLRGLLTEVRPGWSRVEADEVTYPLHVIIRLSLERDLILGSLEPADVRDAWNAAYENTLGVAPQNDRQGCLQDIHWYRGLFGYFQSYLIGTLAAAQLRETAYASHSGVAEGFDQGDAAPLLGWLRSNLFVLARRYELDDLMLTATCAPLNSEAFVRHIDAAYPAVTA